jgi:hypothetical protein
MSGASVNDLIDEGCWEIVLGTSLIEVSKIGADPNSSMFLVDWDRV